MSIKKNIEIISVIVNCYNEEETIQIFYDRVIPILESIKNTDYELIFINDNSTDDTLKVIKSLNKINSKVRYISFRNFGKEQGIYAGYETSRGDYIVCMDVDLQDPPELIPEMYKIIKSGKYDSVATRSITRNGYSLFRKILTKLYYTMLSKISSLKMKEGVRDFRMVNRKIADSIILMKEYSRYSRYLFEYTGFKTCWIDFTNQDRSAGTTKWNFRKLFSVALDAFISSSVKLLYFPIFFGLMTGTVSLLMLFVFIVKLIFDSFSFYLFICFILLFFVSMIFVFIGINSLYISKIYLQVLNRPIYLIDETEETSGNNRL